MRSLCCTRPSDVITGEKVRFEIVVSHATDGGEEQVLAMAESDDAASSVVSDMSEDILTSHAQIKSVIDNMEADDEPLIA